MIVRKAEVPPIHFGQLVIHDYTQGRESSSSLATIHVPPGADHPRLRLGFLVAIAGGLAFGVSATLVLTRSEAKPTAAYVRSYA